MRGQTVRQPKAACRTVATLSVAKHSAHSTGVGVKEKCVREAQPRKP